jgi:hypothetical protein
MAGGPLLSPELKLGRTAGLGVKTMAFTIIASPADAISNPLQDAAFTNPMDALPNAHGRGRLDTDEGTQSPQRNVKGTGAGEGESGEAVPDGRHCLEACDDSKTGPVGGGK